MKTAGQFHYYEGGNLAGREAQKVRWLDALGSEDDHTGERGSTNGSHRDGREDRRAINYLA